MALNNREISNKVRVYHRYLGFFLTGIMFMYALSGITLTFRDKEYFKKEVFIEKVIEKNLKELPPPGRGVKNVEYNKTTGELKYIQMQPPKILGMIEKCIKRLRQHLFIFKCIFWYCVTFFVFSSYWMFLPQTDIFRKAIYFTLGGIALSLLMILI